MSVDEVSQGPDAPPRRRRPGLLWAGGLGLAILGVAVLVFGVPVLPSSKPGPSGNASSSPSPSGSASGPDRFTALVSVAGVCPAVVSGRRLTLTFTLENVATQPVVVQSVTPTLPLGGLQTLDARVLGAGSCTDPDTEEQGRRLEPGAELTVRFVLGLPPECPGAYPVAARVLVGVAGETRVADTAVMPDLGSISFPTCRGT